MSRWTEKKNDLGPGPPVTKCYYYLTMISNSIPIVKTKNSYKVIRPVFRVLGPLFLV